MNKSRSNFKFSPIIGSQVEEKIAALNVCSSPGAVGIERFQRM